MNKEVFEPLIGRTIKIERGGKNSRTGKLLHVGDDFLALLAEKDGVIYYPFQHIKSFSENSKDNESFRVKVPEDFKYVIGDTLASVLNNLKSHWVYIGRGGPDKVEGVLHDCNGDFITVLKDEEVIRMSLFHLKNVSYGNAVEASEEYDVKNEDKQKEEDKKKEDKEKMENEEVKKDEAQSGDEELVQ